MSECLVRQWWLWVEFMKVTLRLARHKISASFSMGIRSPCAGSGNMSAWGDEEDIFGLWMSLKLGSNS